MREYGPSEPEFNTKINSPEIQGKFFITEVAASDEEALREYFEFRVNNYGTREHPEAGMTAEERLQFHLTNTENAVPLDTPDIKYDEVKYHENKIYTLRDTDNELIAGLNIDIYTKNNEKQAIIYGLSVSEEYRGKNLAPLLYEVATKRAREAGCIQINAGLAHRNPSSMRAAFKSGFLATYDFSRPEYMDKFLNSGEYYARNILEPATENSSTSPVEYPTQEIPLSEEDKIIEAVKNGWEGYEVIKQETEDEETSKFTMKLRQSNNFQKK